MSSSNPPPRNSQIHPNKDKPGRPLLDRVGYKRTPLNIKLASGEKIYRHVPFASKTASGHPVKGGKANSDELHNSDATFRDRVCVNCICAPSKADSSKEYGRGTSQFNEPVCCMVAKGYGSGGTVCGRCIGLSSSCEEIPEEFEKEAVAKLAEAQQYNTLVWKAVGERTEEETLLLESLIKRFKTFDTQLHSQLKAKQKSPVKARSGAQPAAGALKSERAATAEEVDELRKMLDSQADQMERIEAMLFEIHQSTVEDSALDDLEAPPKPKRRRLN